MNVPDQDPVQCTGSPQTPLTVRVYPDFANSLCRPLENSVEGKSPAESGGLLFGTTEKGVVSLHAFRPFAIWDQYQNHSPKNEQIDKPAGELSGSFSVERDMRNSELVGWWYECQTGSLRLFDRNIQFHNRHFRCATDLMLILKVGRARNVLIELFAPSSNLPTQKFRWATLHLSPDAPLTRPIDVNLEERHTGDYSAVRQIAAAASGVPANTITLVRQHWHRTTGLLCVVSAALFVFAVAMTFAWAHMRAQYLAVTRDSRSVLGRLVQTSDLRLQAEERGEGLLLSWNRNAAAVRSAKQGILHIQDGSEQRTIYLDPSDIANSSIVYKPDSKNASFRLEILGEHGSTISDSVRMLNGLKSIVMADSPDRAGNIVSVPEEPSHVSAVILKQVFPNTKFLAAGLVREGTKVDVRVRIDEKGRVIEAHVTAGRQDNSLLRKAALEAAKCWIFEPAKSDGKNIPSDHTIEFKFHP